jgi:hypothetical protein
METPRLRTSIWLTRDTHTLLRMIAGHAGISLGEVVDILVAHEADRLRLSLAQLGLPVPRPYRGPSHLRQQPAELSPPAEGDPVLSG